MVKRTIRLKEHELNLNTYKYTTEAIRDSSDNSLPLGPHLVRTDSHGFISTGNDVDESSPSIFIIGDSFVESHFADEQLRFASQVERGLQASGSPYRVRNGGHSGMTSLHMLGVLATKMPPLVQQDSKLLLVIGQSDAHALASPGLYWEQTKTLTPFSAPTTESAVMTQPWREEFVRMVTTIVTFAVLHNYDAALSAGLYRNGDFARDDMLQRLFKNDRARYEASIRRRKFIVDTVREIARQHGLPHFDASEEFLERPDYFYDHLHLNLAGQTAYSRALTSWIADEWLGRQA